MTKNINQPELEINPEVADVAYKVGIEAAIKASLLVLQYWPNVLNQHFNQTLNLNIEEKGQGTGNYVTSADKGSEKLIIEAIQANPVLIEHKIAAEESDPIYIKRVRVAVDYRPN